MQRYNLSPAEFPPGALQQQQPSIPLNTEPGHHTVPGLGCQTPLYYRHGKKREVVCKGQWIIKPDFTERIASLQFPK